jgi:hypothetical protein
MGERISTGTTTRVIIKKVGSRKNPHYEVWRVIDLAIGIVQDLKCLDSFRDYMQALEFRRLEEEDDRRTAEAVALLNASDSRAVAR